MNAQKEYDRGTPCHIPFLCDIMAADPMDQFNSRRTLFEQEQHLGDCGLTGRFAEKHNPDKPPSIAVNNHQEEINNEKK